VLKVMRHLLKRHTDKDKDFTTRAQLVKHYLQESLTSTEVVKPTKNT